ncbi:MAG: hypothetical protein L0154_15880 [Chloroflexi bacterium]|nr:hypothetical protein [Chloroflexota bacterium]
MKYYRAIFIVLIGILVVTPSTLSSSTNTNNDCFVYDIQWSPNGEMVAISGEFSTYIVRYESRQLLDYIVLEHESPAHALDFSYDNEILITGHRNGDLILWNVELEQIQHHLKAHTNRVNAIAASAISPIFVSGSMAEPIINIWSLDTGEKLEEMTWTHGTASVIFDPHQDIIVITGPGFPWLYFHDLENNQFVDWVFLTEQANWAGAIIGELEYSNDSIISIATNFSHLGLYDVETDTLHTLRTSTEYMDNVSLSYDNSFLSAPVDEKIIVWELDWTSETVAEEEGKLLYNARKFGPDIRFHPEENLLAVVDNGHIMLWDVNTMAMVSDIEFCAASQP